MKVDGDVQISLLSENETTALNDVPLHERKAEKAVLKVLSSVTLSQNFMRKHR